MLNHILKKLVTMRHVQEMNIRTIAKYKDGSEESSDDIIFKFDVRPPSDKFAKMIYDEYNAQAESIIGRWAFRHEPYYNANKAISQEIRIDVKTDTGEYVFIERDDLTKPYAYEQVGELKGEEE